MELFKLPRNMGTTEDGTEVVVNIGRFGPYARFGDEFVSLKKDDDPYKVTLARCIELYEAKQAALEAATIRHWPEENIRIVKGRFGPYVSEGKLRARIAKGTDASTLSHRGVDASRRRRVVTSTRQHVDGTTRRCALTRRWVDASTLRRVDPSTRQHVDVSTTSCCRRLN